jgi:hypothetical protein
MKQLKAGEHPEFGTSVGILAHFVAQLLGKNALVGNSLAL